MIFFVLKVKTFFSLMVWKKRCQIHIKEINQPVMMLSKLSGSTAPDVSSMVYHFYRVSKDDI